MKKLFVLIVLLIAVIAIWLGLFHNQDTLFVNIDSVESVYVNHGEERTVVTNINKRAEIINWINKADPTETNQHNGVYTSRLSLVITTDEETILIETNIARHDTLPLLQATQIQGSKQHYYNIESKELNSFLLGFTD